MKRCASLKSLQAIKDVTPEIAKRVRTVWRELTRKELLDQFPCCAEYDRLCYFPAAPRYLRRLAINSLIETHGVEHLGQSRRTRQHVYYCNAGDTYATTVLFNGDTLSVGCMGDLIERNAIIENQDNWT